MQHRPERVDPDVWDEVVAFLRDWLPGPAAATYREMIKADPEGWCRHPHFGDGVVVEHMLRGNGITEKVLGVRSLDLVWAGLLREAVMKDEEG